MCIGTTRYSKNIYNLAYCIPSTSHVLFFSLSSFSSIFHAEQKSILKALERIQQNYATSSFLITLSSLFQHFSQSSLSHYKLQAFPGSPNNSNSQYRITNLDQISLDSQSHRNYSCAVKMLTINQNSLLNYTTLRQLIRLSLHYPTFSTNHTSLYLTPRPNLHNIIS